jgi:hypothetical protein
MTLWQDIRFGFVRTSMLRLQQQQMLLRSKLDRVYGSRAVSTFA